MSTAIFFLSCGLLALIVLSKIPGVEHLVRPVISLLFTAIEAALANLWSWGVYVLKNLVTSHVDLVKHLLLSAEQIDPTHNLSEERD